MIDTEIDAVSISYVGGERYAGNELWVSQSHPNHRSFFSRDRFWKRFTKCHCLFIWVS